MFNDTSCPAMSGTLHPTHYLLKERILLGKVAWAFMLHEPPE